MSATQSMQELFSRDPLEYADKDLETIIEHYRGKRQTFQASMAKSGTGVRGAKKIAAAEKTAKDLGIDTSNLGDLL